MRGWKKWILLILGFTAFVWVFLWGIFNIAATPLANFLLKKFVSTPAHVEKVKTDWLLTRLYIEGLEVENPKYFGGGKMLSVKEIYFYASPKILWTFKQYWDVKLTDMYLHYIRNSKNISNIAVAFGLPFEQKKVEPVDFELLHTNATIKANTLKDIKIHAVGYFKEYGTKGRFTVNATADVSDMKNPKMVMNFKVDQIKLSLSGGELGNPALLALMGSKQNMLITKIVGSLNMTQTRIDVNYVKFYNQMGLMGEILKGSWYDKATHELYIKGKLYKPVYLEFLITGTDENPKFKILNLPQGNMLETLLNQLNTLQKK
jgi:hypothetical protein